MCYTRGMQPPTQSQFPFWQVQKPGQPLFSATAWNKPEQRTQAGRLGIIGGNKLGFAGVASAYSAAHTAGVGEVRVLLPQALQSSLPPSMVEATFAPSNTSGSLARDAISQMRALGAWAGMILLAGDAGRSSETAITYDDFIHDYHGPLVLTRDAIDLVAASHPQLLERPDTLFVASFAQVQKLLTSVYYPKMLTFSMQLLQLVDVLHKFTITYPTVVVTLHKDNLVIAHGGHVVTQQWANPMLLWRGEAAAHIASWYLWSPRQPLHAAATAICEL